MSNTKNPGKLKMWWVEDTESGKKYYFDNSRNAEDKFDELKSAIWYSGILSKSINKREVITKLMTSFNIKDVLITIVIIKEK